MSAMRAAVGVDSEQFCVHTHAVEEWRGLVMPFKGGGVVMTNDQRNQGYVKHGMMILMIPVVV